jgi:hypothetical protein
MALYALYDTKAETYLPIIEGKSDAHAIRTIADAMAKGLPVAEHPEDYALWKICEYDNLTGYVTQDVRPELVCSVLSIISQYFTKKEGEQMDIEEYTNGAKNPSASGSEKLSTEGADAE